MHTRKNNTKKTDASISPVIGVILMVAITVGMAAIVSSWSTGVKASATPVSVGLDISRSGNYTSVLVTSIDPASAAPLTELNISYKNWNGTTFNTLYLSIPNASVGMGNDNIPTNWPIATRLIIAASYKDGSKKVLFNQEV
ncbi:MAG: type IV pilin N-terminal domain-containing protein [Candidatus Methanoperedens sp.]|nr:type IV pilin N-terminal domain-containing protein [Candidatus Methanoperedens sp.]